MVSMDLSLVNDRPRLIMLARVSDRSWSRWCGDPSFSAWWNAAVVKLCRMQAGPALARLHELVMHPKTTEMARVKGIDTFLRHAGIERTPNAEGALFAMLEKWKTARVRVDVELTSGEGGEEVKPATVSEAPPNLQIPAVRTGSALDRMRTHATACNLHTPPPEAMRSGPSSIEAAARTANHEMEQVGVDEEAQRVEVGDGTEGIGRPWDRVAHDEGVDDQDQVESGGGLPGSESRTGAAASREPHAYDEAELDQVLARLNQKVDDSS